MLPHVVIIGGGFGGLSAARTLRDADVRVTLIDRRNHHVFQPLLYQVATATLSPGDIAAPIRWILRRVSNVRVLLADAARIDVNARRVELTRRRRARLRLADRRDRIEPRIFRSRRLGAERAGTQDA